MIKDLTQFRDRFLRWKAGKRVYDAGKIVEKSDNTSVQKQEPVLPIKRDFVAEATRKHAAETVGPDTRSLYQRKQSLAAKLYANQQYQKAKDDAKCAEGLELMMKTVSPATYIEAATGLDLGEVGRLAADVIVFGLPGAITKSTRKAIKPLLSELKKSSNLAEYSYKGFDLRMDNDKFKVLQKFVAENELAGKDVALFGDNIVKKGKKYSEYPSAVIENLKNSIYPRMKAMRPWVNDFDFNRKFYNVADGKWSMHPAETFKLAYGDTSRTIGQYSPITDNIALRAGTDIEPALLHEIRHKLDDHIPLTHEEEGYLKLAYGDLFLSSNSSKGYDMFEEAVTTNRDARDILLGPVHSRRTPVNLLNKMIDMASDQLILESIADSNGYGEAFVDAIIGDGPLDASLVPKEQILAWRNAMKYVGSAALTFGLSKPFIKNTRNEPHNK